MKRINFLKTNKKYDSVLLYLKFVTTEKFIQVNIFCWLN